MKFQIDFTMLKYCQNKLNSCCFSSLASAFYSINQIKYANAISKRTEESLTSQVSLSNHIDFSNAV